jgi:Leucine-rich repeat (LRR) protein
LIHRTELDLIGCDNVTAIPKELVNLVSLACQFCVGIREIPKELVNLKFLYCNSTNISEIPKELVNLERLSCANTKVKEIPKELVNLVFLRIDYNDIKHIPKHLTKLETLCCSKCSIISIPNFEKLKILCADSPNLTFAPTHAIDDFGDKNVINQIETNYLNYRKDGCKKLVSIILEELIQRTWEPKRAIEWCWDEEEKRFMNGMLN